MDLFGLIQTLNGAQKTQQDIGVIAQVAQQAQSPAVQQEIRAVASKAEVAAIAMLTLQAISTAAAVGILLVHLKNSRKRR